jgi:hypothetical protein
LNRFGKTITSGAEARTSIVGVGAVIAAQIDEFLVTKAANGTGEVVRLAELRLTKKAMGAVELTTVNGVGPTFARKMVEQGICSIAELQAHVKQQQEQQTGQEQKGQNGLLGKSSIGGASGGASGGAGTSGAGGKVSGAGDKGSAKGSLKLGQCPVGPPAGPPAVGALVDDSMTVYSTRSGKKYHQWSCSNCHRGSLPPTPITLLMARGRKLAACSQCKPLEVHRYKPHVGQGARMGKDSATIDTGVEAGAEAGAEAGRAVVAAVVGAGSISAPTAESTPTADSTSAARP